MPGDDEVPEIFQRVIKAFQKHEQLSRENTRLEIAESLKEFKHFKALARQDNCLDYFYAAIPFLKYQRIRKRDFVFHHSDRGGVFYFILKGRAGVLIPKTPDAIAKEIELNAIIINCGVQIAETVIPEEKAMLEADRAIALKQLTAMRDPYSEDLMSKQKIRYFKDDGRVCLFKQVNTLRSTDSFGEVSIVSNKKLRTASVIAEDEELHLLSMTGDNYVTVFDQELSRLNFTLHVLEETFTKATRDSIVRLAYEFKEIVLDKNQIIFKEGQPATQVFLVKTGEIEIIKDIKKLQVASFFNPKGNTQTIVKETPSNFIRKYEIKSQTIAILGAEAFFGLEEKQFHQFSARSSSNNSVVFSIDRQLLEDYNVWKLLQKRSAMKNQFYSERFYKIKELEEYQDVQRAQPRRPDFQMLMKAGEKMGLEVKKEQEKQITKIGNETLFSNNEMKSKARSSSTLHDDRLKQLITSKEIPYYMNTTSKNNKETKQDTNLKQAQKYQINIKNETKQQQCSNMNQQLENNTDRIQSDFYAQVTERSNGSEPINIFQTQILHSSELGLNSVGMLRQDQPEASKIGMEGQEEGTRVDKNYLFQPLLPTNEVINMGNEDQQDKYKSEQNHENINNQHDFMTSQNQKEQIFQTSQAEQQGTQQPLNGQNSTLLNNNTQAHPQFKLHWSSILSSTSNNNSLRHHKTTSLCLNTVFRNPPEMPKVKIIQGQHSLSVNEPIEDQNNRRHETDHASTNREHTLDNRPRITSWNEMSSIEQPNVRYANEKTAQNVCSLHSFSSNNNNNHQTINGSNILIGNNIEEPNIYGLNPRQLLHFGEEKSNLQPQPKLQFKLVIQDLLEQRDISETLNYFKKNLESKIGASWQGSHKRSLSNYKSPDITRRSTKDLSHRNTIQKKTEGFEGQIETQSIQEKIGQTLTYNQTVLDQKKQEQQSRLQESLEQEKLEYLKLQKHAAIRYSKRKQDDFLSGVSGGSEQQINQVIMKLNQGQEDPLSSLVCLPKEFQQHEEYEGNNTQSQSNLQQTQSQPLVPHETNLHLSIKSLPPLFKTTTNLKIGLNSSKNIFPISKRNNNQNNSKTTQAFMESRRSSSILMSQQQPTSPTSRTVIQQVQNIDLEQQIADVGYQREQQLDQQDQHTIIDTSDQTGNFSHRSTNPMNEITQLQQLASMHIKKTTKMSFYKNKPNLHLLDQKKIKCSSSLERQQQVNRMISLKALEQHKGLFPVIHSVKAKQN